jgi:hypothetical protein
MARPSIHAGNEIVIPDASVAIQPGDEMRRSLPNGTDEAFEVVDPQFFEETLGIEPHFQVKVRRKGMFPHQMGGNFNINVSGPNSRVNVGSTDNSTNLVGSTAVFGELQNAISNRVSDETERSKLLSAVRDMEQSHGGSGFLAAYQRFMASAADHMGVVGPFLPALASLLGS